jgi:hypothetical protein
MKIDPEGYETRAQKELDLAALASDPAVKAGHLNKAAEYATLGERSKFERR